MADLGAITQEEYKINQDRLLPYWRQYGNTANWSAIDMTGSITVTVKLDAVNYPNAVVYLYYKKTGNWIDKKITDASGQATFNNLDVNDAGAYIAVADIPGGSLNMIVYGYL